ncbi:hypothetical protein ACIQW5_10490 [Methylorubrum thiocyanatum]|uniref:hypothetical protein n=1 Tax=Methylorubrum thiocyanatum TaxID=47958 RepID=UPI00383B3A07
MRLGTMHPDDAIHYVAPVAFKAADKFFKFVSWIIIIVALRYAATVSGNQFLYGLQIVAGFVFVISLLLQAFYLFMRDPETLGMPPQLRTASRIVQVILGLAVMFFCASPYLIPDQIIDSLFQVQVAAKSKP